METRYYSFSNYTGAKHCTLKNGTSVFYDKKGLDCACLSSIPSDPDFGGIGIVSAFLSMSFLTILISFIPTVYSVSRQWRQTQGPKRFKKWLWAIIQFEENHIERPTGSLVYPPRHSIIPVRRRKGYNNDEELQESSSSVTTYDGSDSKQPLPSSRPFNNLTEDEPIACLWARRVLFKLCDIQIITGTAMLISALADHETLTFYHAQLASQYWWLCLNSWWTSRIDYSRTDASMTTWRAHARRCSIFVSVALSIVLQIIVTIREEFDWDPLEPGKCYLADAAGTSYFQNILWLCATCLYFAVISLSLFTVSREWFDRNVNDKIVPSIRFMNDKFQGSIRGFSEYRKSTASHGIVAITRLAVLAFMAVKTVLLGIAWACWWLLILVSSILVSGNSSAALEAFIYTGIASFIAWWIIFLFVKNRDLIVGPEYSWNFGNSLICLLFLFIFYHSIDVYATVRRDEHINRRKKADEEAQQTMLGSDTSAKNDFAIDGANVMDEQAVESLPAAEAKEMALLGVEKDATSKEKL